MKVAIMGLGMVGGALKEVLKDPILYDPPKGIGNKEELNEAEVIFICVPTPFDKKFDLSFVIQALDDLEGEKIVVLKSTVLPGTTDILQNNYPQHRFMFNPEFLTESSADQDMKFPDRQIIGCTEQSFSMTQDIMMMLPQAPYERIIPAKEAEMIKYFNNCWFYAKVMFANQMYDLCEKVGVDYDVVKHGASADKRMTGTSHLEIFHQGYRGVKGKCLPKDLDTLIQYGDDNKVNMSLLKEVKSINEKL